MEQKKKFDFKQGPPLSEKSQKVYAAIDNYLQHLYYGKPLDRTAMKEFSKAHEAGLR